MCRLNRWRTCLLIMLSCWLPVVMAGQSTSVQASLASPAPGTILGSSATFSWTAGTGATMYDLFLGTTGVGSCNLYNSGHITATSATVTGLPENGVMVYARLWSEIGGAWQSIDYTYTESGTPVAAVLTSPTPGSTFSGSGATFTWTLGTGVTEYDLFLGTTGVGSYNLYNSGHIATTSASVAGLPENGKTIYARLWSEIDGIWQSTDYTYTESGTPVAAVLTSPTPGSTFSGSGATFTWTPGTGVTEYDLFLGTTGVGSSNLYNSGHITATSAAVTGLPENGVTVYARLWSEIGGAWQTIDYTYIESGTPVKAVLTTPAPGTALTGSSANFSWTAGGGVTMYALYLGTTGVGSSNLYNSGHITATSAAVTGLPMNGATIYARLWSEINAAWQYTDYIYTEAPLPGTLSSLSCSSGSMTGSGTDACKVTLTAGAASGGLAVNLSSSSTAITVPATVTVPANATSVGFTATVSWVTSAQTATLTASAGSVSETFAVQLNAATPTLSINATSVAFGDVVLNTPTTQSLTLTSTGTAPVTISATSLTGTGFTLSGATCPPTLNPGQAATLSVQFDPTATGAATGQLTITSNSSTGATAVIGLSGTGEPASYSVSLSWEAPSSSTDPVAGYNVYRAPSGSSSYQLLNSSVDTETTYVDSTVQGGLTYEYMVESVDASGVESTASNTFNVTIP
jgi:hypothetical protein